MKLYIFSPNSNALFSQNHIEQLQKSFEVVIYSEIKPFTEHVDFLNDASEKIVALDPDFFDWNFPESNIAMMNNVKAICLQTTSFSWIDSGAAQKMGIPVLNLRGFSKQSVAEYAMLLTYGVARKIALVAQNDYVQDFVAHQGIELKGKVAGIIGLGNIGTCIAQLCAGIGMDVVYWSHKTRNDTYTFCELETLLKTADVIYVAVAHNSETEQLLTKDRMATIKSTSMLINITHNIFDEQQIIQMVQSGQLYGYGYESDNANPVQHKGNIFGLPSLAWATQESMNSNADMWVDSMISAGRGNLKNVIN